MNFYIFQLCGIAYLCSGSITESSSVIVNESLPKTKEPVCVCLLGLGNCTNTKHCREKLQCLLAFMIFESFSFLSSSLLLVTLLQPDKCVSLIALMTQCPVSHPLLTGHTCVEPEQRMILSPLSASPLPLFNSELHHLRNQPGHSGFTSSWLCERFVFLILTLCAAED